MRRSKALIPVLFLGLLITGTAQAQYEPGYGSHLEVNFNGGVLLVDQDLVGPSREDFNEAGEFIGDQDGERDSSPIIGARAIYHLSNGFGFGGQYAWSPIHGDDVELDLYSAELSYTFPVQALTVFAAAGGGRARVTFDEEDLFAGDEVLAGQITREEDTHWFVPLALGFKYFITDRFAFTAKARDNIIFNAENPLTSDVEELDFEGESQTTHNFQFTGGFSFMLR